MKTIRNNIPNCITSINLLGGIAAIICGMQAREPLWGLTGREWAYIFIGISALADFFDGFVARAMKAYSEMGKELDSLCDLVSFGIAPTVLMWSIYNSGGMPLWGCWITLFTALCGAWRLARFNVSEPQSGYFTGLPIPANAIFWIGYSAMLGSDASFERGAMVAPLVFNICLGLLMVGNVKLWTLKFKNFKFGKANVVRISLVIVAVAAVITLGLQGLAVAILYYILISIIIKPERA